MNATGLDQEAIQALQAETQVHLQKVAEIGQKNPGVWSYELCDEEKRHRRSLEQLFSGAKQRTQYRA